MTRLEYDTSGNLTAIINPLGQRTTLTYNDVGQPLTGTDPLGNAPASSTTRWAISRPPSTPSGIEPPGNTTPFRGSAANSMRGPRSTFGYDVLNRVETVLDGWAVSHASPTTATAIS